MNTKWKNCKEKKINFYQGNTKLGVFFVYFFCSQAPFGFLIKFVKKKGG